MGFNMLKDLYIIFGINIFNQLNYFKWNQSIVIFFSLSSYNFPMWKCENVKHTITPNGRRTTHVKHTHHQVRSYHKHK